ncbi:uncharacterized protein [Aegilops tauschii subsp. strangulata]|uniref:uncharacterized protein n=1 Tax=Aegilops tauschii subsp. strangulata TaxID=200361 RepID=UPI001ABC3039|nr:uncharacterized protein LOC120962656 [Aegilops tauschii subsp. strangulata]
MSFPDSLKGWQGTWFYCKDVPSANSLSGLPPYSAERVRAPPTLTLEKEEKVGVDITLIGIVNDGVNGMDLLETFFSRRIHPLQAKAHPMWLYEGPGDSTRVHPEDVTEKELGTKIKAITCARDNLRGTRLVPAFHKDLPPIEDFQNLISWIPMVDHLPQDVMSDTEQQYSERSDDESDDDDDDDEESSEEGEEPESSPFYEAPKEPRSKAQAKVGSRLSP